MVCGEGATLYSFLVYSETGTMAGGGDNNARIAHFQRLRSPWPWRSRRPSLRADGAQRRDRSPAHSAPRRLYGLSGGSAYQMRLERDRLVTDAEGIALRSSYFYLLCVGTSPDGIPKEVVGGSPSILCTASTLRLRCAGGTHKSTVKVLAASAVADRSGVYVSPSTSSHPLRSLVLG